MDPGCLMFAICSREEEDEGAILHEFESFRKIQTHFRDFFIFDIQQEKVFIIESSARKPEGIYILNGVVQSRLW